jgi:type II secretory pathway predicted ATPase ExeA/septal ring-binding cell division protein DamX
MYLEHFGLSEPPFRITPHTDFFFGGANRGATLDALIYAITHDEGIVKVSGEVGSGKTMLCRVLMERLPEHVTIVYLANPSLSRDDILYAIADELRIDVPDNSRTALVMRALQDHLIAAYGEGRQVVVLIDEAHAMPTETLEEIRLLSNLESNRSKLLQLVLFGQPELNDVLSRPDMRQLKERITHNFVLEPLVREDIADYLDFRMRAAGYRGPSVFATPALKLITQASRGLTRRINIIADKSLLAAFSAGTHAIGDKEAQAAIRDCEFSDATYRTPAGKSRRLLWLGAGLAAAAIVAGALLFQPGGENPAPGQKEAQGIRHSPAPPIPAPPASPAPPPVGDTGQTSPAVPPPPAPSAAAGIPGPDRPAPPPAAVAPGPPAGAPPNPTPPSPQVKPPAAAAAGAPAAPAGPSAAVAVLAAAEPATSAQPAVQPAPWKRFKLGRLTRERLEASLPELEKLPDSHWFIQLFDAEGRRHGEVEAFLRRIAQIGADAEAIRVYYSELSGAPRFGVIYGDYSSREAATTAIRGLPPPLRANMPYPRQVIRLR